MLSYDFVKTYQTTHVSRCIAFMTLMISLCLCQAARKCGSGCVIVRSDDCTQNMHIHTQMRDRIIKLRIVRRHANIIVVVGIVDFLIYAFGYCRRRTTRLIWKHNMMRRLRLWCVPSINVELWWAGCWVLRVTFHMFGWHWYGKVNTIACALIARAIRITNPTLHNAFIETHSFRIHSYDARRVRVYKQMCNIHHTVAPFRYHKHKHMWRVIRGSHSTMVSAYSVLLFCQNRL